MAYLESAVILTSDVTLTVQGIVGRERIAALQGANGSNPVQYSGAGWTFIAPSATAQTPDWTTGWLSIPKSLNVSNAAAGSQLAYITTNADFSLSSTLASAGGFFMLARVGFRTHTAGARAFFGFSTTNTAGFGNVEPSSVLNMCGFGADSGDSQFTFMHNDGAGTATKDVINGGAGFPCHTSATDFYEFVVAAAAGQTSSISWKATNVLTGVTASGSIAADLPTANAALRCHLWWSNGTTASAITNAISGVHVRTEY